MGVGAVDRRTAIAALAALGLARPATGLADPSISLGGAASRLPQDGGYVPPTTLSAVLDNYRRMTCPVTINGAGPFGFVADTGANHSVIAAEIVAQLGLPLAADQPLNGVAGMEMTPTVKVGLTLAGRPERPVVLSVLPGAAIGGQGILGLDQLNGARLTLDFAHNLLFLDAGPALPGEGPQIEMSARRHDGQLFLIDAGVGGIPVAAFVDSGAESTIGNMALYALAFIHYPSIPWKVTPVVSVTGQTIDAQYADLPSLR
ncbi:MAG TPA: retropepsin-like aspartic protease, partial [Caulobacteraceae bacterium]|nr:retropepsin-like aspartic protease [Caulobacteraceae bacterium]